MIRPDIQPIIGAMAQAIVMQERWAAGCLYLHDTGDLDAAREAMAESDRWRDRAVAIERMHTDPLSSSLTPRYPNPHVS